MFQIVRTLNPKALDVPQINALFARAFEGSIIADGDFRSNVDEFRTLIADPTSGVFLGAEKGFFKALGIILLPTGKLIPAPQILHFYNEGSLGLKRALMTHGIDFLREKGYNSFWAINGAGIDEKLWKRAFRGAGAFEPIGTLVKVSI